MILKVKNVGGGWVYYDKLGVDGLEVKTCTVQFDEKLGPSSDTPQGMPRYSVDFGNHGGEIPVEHQYLTENHAAGEPFRCHLAVLYAEEENPKRIAFEWGYLMNDDGRTIEVFRPMAG